MNMNPYRTASFRDAVYKCVRCKCHVPMSVPYEIWTHGICQPCFDEATIPIWQIPIRHECGTVGSNS